jgi:hypothetical protein
MKLIPFFICGLVLLVANTAEARRNRWSNNQTYTTYTRPVASAPTTSTAQVAYKLPVADTAQGTIEDAAAASSPAANSTSETSVTTAANSTSATTVKTALYSTATAQGVANLMASYNRVGHFGGNPGYEGCGCGATPAAAYSICCYGNSGMATVDVGYAQGANGMWYCCRRYR